MSILKRKSVIILILLLSSIVLLAIGYINMQPKEVLRNHIELSNHIPNSTGPVMASYPYYETYDSADQFTDLIIIGNVVKVNDPEEIVTGEATNTFTGEKVPVSHTFIVSEIEVSKVMKGDLTPGEKMKIKQFYNLGEEKIFQEGERHIFFLQSYENDIPCSTINPQQGDMLIVDGKIKKSNEIQFINDGVTERLAVKAMKDRIER